MNIAVLIPHIDIREKELMRALESVNAQTMPPEYTHIQRDDTNAGSAHTRNLALPQIDTEWVAFLDDDDEFLPHHLDELWRCAQATGADVVYPGCNVIGGTDPHDRFGQEFDPELLRQKSYIPVTSLVRMEMIKNLFREYGEAFHRPEGSNYDDWGFYLRLLDAGAKFVHHPVKTWVWHHWMGNTSGLPQNVAVTS